MQRDAGHLHQAPRSDRDHGVRYSDQISASADPTAEARRIEEAVIEAFKVVFRKMEEGTL